MKSLKEFIEDLAKNNKLREKFKDITDLAEIVKMAKKEGYKFTEDEYMDKQLENVSGGAIANCEFTEEAFMPWWMSKFQYQHCGGKEAINKWLENGIDPREMTVLELGGFVMSGGKNVSPLHRKF